MVVEMFMTYYQAKRAIAKVYIVILKILAVHFQVQFMKILNLLKKYGLNYRKEAEIFNFNENWLIIINVSMPSLIIPFCY